MFLLYFWLTVLKKWFVQHEDFNSSCLSDPHVRAREVHAEGESVVAGVLEHHWPHGHPHLLHRDGASPARPAPDELREGHLLCQYHLLVHKTAWHLWGEQIPGSIRHDDRKDGEGDWWSALIITQCLMIKMVSNALDLSYSLPFHLLRGERRWLTWCILWSSCWWCWWVLEWHGRPSSIPMRTRPGCWPATSSSCRTGWSMERCLLTKSTVRLAYY